MMMAAKRNDAFAGLNPRANGGQCSTAHPSQYLRPPTACAPTNERAGSQKVPLMQLPQAGLQHWWRRNDESFNSMPE
jgi:hypothetical protein